MDALTASLTAGALGLAGGFSPGPLTALAIRQTLTYGVREGAKVSLAPVLTDGPLLILSAFAAGALAASEFALGLVSLFGAVFLLWMGWESLRVRPLVIESQGEATSLLRAFVTNLLNPAPYIFWIGVGGPSLAKAYSHSLKSATVFVVAFFLALCGSKLLVAVAVGRARAVIAGEPYLWTVRILGLVMWFFAVGFVRDGMRMLRG